MNAPRQPQHRAGRGVQGGDVEAEQVALQLVEVVGEEGGKADVVDDGACGKWMCMYVCVCGSTYSDWWKGRWSWIGR